MAEVRASVPVLSDYDSDESVDKPLRVNTSYAGSDGDNSEYESADDDELIGIEGEEPDEEAQKNLDDDEDRKNPQYIPKRGTFYEHDDRNLEEIEASEKENKESPQPKKEPKKVWKEDDRWNHDKFDLGDQGPKSRDELIAAYGYDIRNEDGPPRARRRRRYGRGPNKYTRNWEDVNAYQKPTRGGSTRGAVPFGGKSRGPRSTNFNPQSEMDFPSLHDSSNPGDEQSNIEDDYSYNESAAQYGKPRNSNRRFNKFDNDARPSQGRNQWGKEYDGEPKKGRGRGRGFNASQSSVNGRDKVFYSKTNQHDAHKYQNAIDVSRIVYHGRNDVRISPTNDIPNTVASMGRSSIVHQDQGLAGDVDTINSDMNDMSLSSKDNHYAKIKQHSSNIDSRSRGPVPLRVQDSMRASKTPPTTPSPSSVDQASLPKPKRYSSQRQRPIQESLGQFVPQASHSNYFEQNHSAEHNFSNEMYDAAISSPTTNPVVPPSTLSTQGPPFVPPPAGFNANPIFSPVVTQPAHLIGPPNVGGPIPGTAPVGAPPVAGGSVSSGVGAPFLPSDNLMNFGTAAPPIVAGPHPPQFPAFQGFPPPPVTQPPHQDFYSNGITYYDPGSQQHLPRIKPIFQKRPKAAIPIVPPPEDAENQEEFKKSGSREPEMDYSKYQNLDRDGRLSLSSDQESLSEVSSGHDKTEEFSTMSECKNVLTNPETNVGQESKISDDMDRLKVTENVEIKYEENAIPEISESRENVVLKSEECKNLEIKSENIENIEIKSDKSECSGHLEGNSEILESSLVSTSNPISDSNSVSILAQESTDLTSTKSELPVSDTPVSTESCVAVDESKSISLNLEGTPTETVSISVEKIDTTELGESGSNAALQANLENNS